MELFTHPPLLLNSTKYIIKIFIFYYQCNYEIFIE